MSGNRNSLLVAVIFSIAVSFAAGHSTFAQTVGKVPTDSAKVSYLKFSAFPFFYALFRNDSPYASSLWLILQFESQFKANSKKFSYNIVIDFQSHYQGKITFAGAIDFRLRPQVRYYPDGACKGLFYGVFPHYAYKGGLYTSIIGSYWGGGAVIGSQAFVKNRIPVEVNFNISVLSGNVSMQDFTQGTRYDATDTYGYALIEVNIGMPIKKRK